MISRDGGRMVVRGHLTIETVPALFDAGVQHFSSEDLVVDFSQVENVDSAAVSMLLGWLRAAQRSQRTVTVTGLPEDLLSLARLYGVDNMLPQQVA
ncbi:MAG: STAS domain-containing protein [Gallionella sp.]|nr:STAS domain-containing protein [Gallionella sp.]